MKKVALIPARLDSTRLPKKLLLPLAEKPIIVHTYETVERSKLFDAVYVITNSPEISEVLEQYDCNYKLLEKSFETGTDRIAHALDFLPKKYDIVVNVQGDEPKIDMQPIADILSEFEKDSEKKIDLMSLMHPLEKQAEIKNPNNVKVIVNQQNKALYFSRSPIPYLREKNETADYFKHIGVYAFRYEALHLFSKQPQTPLEMAEKIEAIRFLEMGKKIQMLKVKEAGFQIDTQEDYDKAKSEIN